MSVYEPSREAAGQINKPSAFSTTYVKDVDTNARTHTHTYLCVIRSI